MAAFIDTWAKAPAMSNHLAASTVSAVLRKTIQTALDSADPGISNAKATTLRPNTAQAELPTPGVNIYLYQVSPNPQLRTGDLPTRNAAGTVTQKPTSALDLHYLISFTGDDSKLEPQTLFGITARALNTQPIVTRQLILDTLSDPLFSFLSGTDLVDAPDLVRVTPLGLSLDDLSKLWSVVFQTPYLLSAVYRASAIFIEADLPAQGALPVRAASVFTDAQMPPAVEALGVQTSSGVVLGAPINAGSTVIVTGSRISGSRVTSVVFDSGEEAAAVNPTATSLSVALPTTLRAGGRTLRVAHRRASQPSATDVLSDPFAFELQPAVTASLVAGLVRLGFTPAVYPAQQISLLLNEIGSGANAPRAFTFELPLRTGTAPTTSIDVPIPGVTTGTFLVRVQVDGAESLPTFNPTAGRYDTPQVVVP